MIAKVEPLTPARALRGPFDYLVPSRMSGVDIGSMLVVPFGRRRMLGVVVDLAEVSEVPADRLLEPLAALERDVPRELLRLGLEVAAEYCSTPARGLALVLPPGTGRGGRPGVTPRRELVAHLTDAGRRALGERNGSAPGSGRCSAGFPAVRPPPPRRRATRAVDTPRCGPSSAADWCASRRSSAGGARHWRRWGRAPRVPPG